MPLSDEDIERLAAVVDDAAMKATPIPMLSIEEGEITLDEGYAIQRASMGLRRLRADDIIGMKMGLTSEAKMRQVGVHSPIYGHLTDAMRIEDGGALSRVACCHPRAEPELCFLLAAPLSDGSSVTGVHWCVNTGVADVARGALRRQWGASGLQEVLSGVRFELAPDAFFQTHTAAAEVLITTISEALGPVSGTLLDLYCGTGSIGITLADRFEEVFGIEEVAAAVRDAQENARENGVTARYLCAKVEAELAELSTAEAGEFLAELGIAEPAAHLMIRAAYGALDQHSFFTVGSKYAATSAWPFLFLCPPHPMSSVPVTTLPSHGTSLNAISNL